MSEDLEQRRYEWLEKHGYLPDHLSVFVEDVKCQAANAINNQGLKAQVAFLMKHMSFSDLQNALAKQRDLLIKHSLKVEPGKCRGSK